jgi:DNA topoisomerase-1
VKSDYKLHQEDIKTDGHTLVICEKPDAAKRIALALTETEFKSITINRVEVFRVKDSQNEYIICSALGHLYTIADPFRNRDVYPVFDLEWFPTYLINKDAKKIKERIEIIRGFASNAKRIVNACDFDVEGETIGYNILRYSCEGKEINAFRAKFSTLTKEELVSAFKETKIGLGDTLARAGRIRHIIDFIWGINLSRALSESIKSNNRFKAMSIGRVQGPTLSFVVEREIQVNSFVPTPYWTIIGIFEKNGMMLEASYSVNKISKKVDAESIKAFCEGKEALASEIRKNVFRQSPPVPFNIGDLQKEAYRIFRYSPNRTLQMAERLYLEALISYPRTNSQKIPKSINYANVLKNLGKMNEYYQYISELLRKELKPNEGEKVDPAHPAIYPTGELPKRTLNTWELRLYDLIVRRFLANFAEDAIHERVIVQINIDKYVFKLFSKRILKEGWLKYYKYSEIEDKPIPQISEGDKLTVIRIDCKENYEGHPARYNQSSLLEKMEKENLGTKATRAEIINTLINRWYITDNSLIATDLGFSVIEAMQTYSPHIISTSLTREIEQRLENIELGREEGNTLIEETIQMLSNYVISLKSHELDIGRRIGQALIATKIAQNTLGNCPICKTGKLVIINSMKTHKRFVGCTNYSKGCKASAPLPQKGLIMIRGKICQYCEWPVIYVKLKRIPWRLCVNINCPSKVKSH